MMTPSTPFTPFAPVGLPFRGNAATAVTPIEPIEIIPPKPVSASMRLARAASLGDTVAMRELLRDLAPRIERVVRAVLGRQQHQDAEDVVQQAMLGFVQALPSFRCECEPIHFASRVAARTAIAAARRGRAARARHEDGVDIDLLTSTIPEPLADAERTRRMAALQEALTRIPSEQAETLALRVVLGWSLSEVAEAMAVPLNTVRSRLRLAKNALRTVIDNDPSIQDELDAPPLPDEK
jgi:RNA polymerase sigma factor (sigma-70 family)